MTAQTLADNIRRRRLAAGLTQTALCERLAISRKTLRSWERGSANNPLVIAVDLAAALGVSLDELALDNRADEGVN